MLNMHNSNLNARHVDGMSLIIRYFRVAKELEQIT